jgi:hypothetical protein
VAPAGSINKNDVELVGSSIADSIFGNIRGVFPITLLLQIDVPNILSGAQFFQVPDVDVELLNGTRTKGIASSD